MYPPILVEVDGAESSRLCAQGGMFQAIMRLACQSYMDPTETCDRFIDYARLLESTGKDVTHFVKLDTFTFGTIARTASGGNADAVGTAGSTDPVVAMSEDEFVAGYERGCFDAKWASSAPQWQVPEYQRVRQALGLVKNAGIKGKIVRYVDFEGGVDGFDPVRDSANGRILWRLLNSPYFRKWLDPKLRSVAAQVLWDALSHTSAAFASVYTGVMRVIGNCHNQTVAAMLGDGGPFFIPNAAAPTRSCPRFDGRPQIGTSMAAGQMPSMGWYMGLNTFGHYGTAACVAAQDCYPDANPPVMHLQLDSDPAELSARLRFARGPCVLFSQSGDLGKLAGLSALVGMWRN